MSQWDVDSSAVQLVLADTGAAAGTIATALDGAADGSVESVSAVASDMVARTQSPLIGTALQGFFQDRQASVSSIMARIEGVMSATARAVAAVLAGHEEMAVSIGDSMGRACASGDFTDLLPDSGQ